MQYLQSQMTSLKQEREKLMDQYSTLNKSRLAAQAQIFPCQAQA